MSYALRLWLVGVKEAQGGLSAELEARLGRIIQEITTQTMDLVSHIKERKLSGQVLKNRTGTLRRDVNPDFGGDAGSVWGSAGFKVFYGKVHELGGTFTIREHTRLMTQVFGNKLRTPKRVTVRSHTATFPRRSFMRTSLRERRAAILQGMRQAARGA